MATTNPYTAMFDMQRTMIESSQKAVEGAVTVQRNMAEATVESAGATKAVQERGVDFSKRAVEAYFEALEDVLPVEAVDELRRATDDQYAAFEDVHQDAWTTFEANLEEGLETYDELSESQLTVLEDAFESMIQMNEDAADAAADIDVVDPSEN